MLTNAEVEKSALFVDLTNFYTRFIKSKLLAPEELRSYFLKWFDFSGLSFFLTGKISDIWIFHSDSRLGPPDARIDGTYLKALTARFDKQMGVTTKNVNISGQQREPYTINCAKCGQESDAIWKSEKGIDSSLIVHLFDTVEYWDQAYILSGDADFVPAVRSLRRRGKIVSGAGFASQASAALIRECFNYYELEDFFKQDLSVYLLLRDISLLLEGIASKQPIKNGEGKIIEGEFQVAIQLNWNSEADSTEFRLQSDLFSDSVVEENFSKPLISNHGDQFPFYVTFDPRLFESIQSKLEAFSSENRFESNKHRNQQSAAFFSFINFQWNPVSQKYTCV